MAVTEEKIIALDIGSELSVWESPTQVKGGDEEDIHSKPWRRETAAVEEALKNDKVKEEDELGEVEGVEEDGEDEEEEVDYEAQRQRNIQRNRQLMMELGLSSVTPRREFPTASRPLSGTNFDDEEYNADQNTSPARAKKRVRRLNLQHTQPVQTRTSKRIRGETAKEYDVDLEALDRATRRDTSSTVPPEQLGSYSSKQRWTGWKQNLGYSVESYIPTCGVPLTLGSIATTIWDMGQLYKGNDNRLKYWSSKGSTFRHPYPIGYKAEKHVFRERYSMEIKEGPSGPIFIVESSKGKIYQGASPTLPWTKVCLDSYSKGTRISGPLFFGFSDPLTQKMIEDLDGYQSWEEVVAEVQAAAKAELDRDDSGGDA